jgi:hypothetical protein
MAAEIRPLSPMNTNYDPPRPWICQADITGPICQGAVVGAVGATPVCEACAPDLIAYRDAERARIMALMDTPAMRREAAREQAWEARVS